MNKTHTNGLNLERVTIQLPNGEKKCGYLFSWGATHQIGKYCKTYKLSDYKTRLKIVRVE